MWWQQVEAAAWEGRARQCQRLEARGLLVAQGAGEESIAYAARDQRQPWQRERKSCGGSPQQKRKKVIAVARGRKRRRWKQRQKRLSPKQSEE